MNRIFFGIILIIPVSAGMFGVYYVSSSRANPHIIGILVGSIALGIVVGIISSLVSIFFRRRIDARPVTATIVAFCWLAFFVAVLTYASNIPNSIKREIPVTYIVNLSTKELPYPLHFPEDTTLGCYMDVAAMFKKFKERSTENSRKVEDLLNANIAPTSGWRIFRDLTEYLVPYFIGHTLGAVGFERSIYRKEIGKCFGWPDQSIVGQPKAMNDISGPFQENLFHGVEGFVSGAKLKMRLPKNTEIALEREGNISSTFVLKNEFLRISIGIRLLVGTYGGHALMHPDAFLSPYGFSSVSAERIEQERKGPFKRYDTIIYYDVTFSKWRYGFPAMRHYEDWANNLFSALASKFAWGSPILVDPWTLKHIRK